MSKYTEIEKFSYPLMDDEGAYTGQYAKGYCLSHRIFFKRRKDAKAFESKLNKWLSKQRELIEGLKE